MQDRRQHVWSLANAGDQYAREAIASHVGLTAPLHAEQSRRCLCRTVRLVLLPNNSKEVALGSWAHVHRISHLGSRSVVGETPARARPAAERLLARRRAGDFPRRADGCSKAERRHLVRRPDESRRRILRSRPGPVIVRTGDGGCYACVAGTLNVRELPRAGSWAAPRLNLRGNRGRAPSATRRTAISYAQALGLQSSASGGRGVKAIARAGQPDARG
jgi:hypothetical protein